MTHDPMTALMAAVNASRAYQSTLRPQSRPSATVSAPAQPAQTVPTLDPETLGRLAAPVVSRLIARDIRERGDLS